MMNIRSWTLVVIAVMTLVAMTHLSAGAAQSPQRTKACLFPNRRTFEEFQIQVGGRTCGVDEWATEKEQVLAAITVADAVFNAASNLGVDEVCLNEFIAKRSGGEGGAKDLVTCFDDWHLDEKFKTNVPHEEHGEASGRNRQQKSNSEEDTSNTSPPYTSYSSPSHIASRMLALNKNFPGFVRLFQVGTTVEGRPVNAIRISSNVNDSNNDGQEEEPRHQVYVTGNLHSREWIATEIAMGFAEFIMERWHTQASIRELFTKSHLELWVIPIVNVDGVEYTFTEGSDETGTTSRRMWRKNRRQYDTVVARGVDLNRNFPEAFGGASSSGVVSSDTYRGPKPLSEPEAQLIVDMLKSTDHFPSLLAHVSVHSYGKEILYPLGSDVSVFGPNEGLLAGIGSLMANAMTKSENGVAYDVRKGAVSYPVGGDSVDTVHIEHGYIPAFTIEARPGFTECCGFVLPVEQIKAAVEENAFSFLTLMSYVAEEMKRNSGGSSSIDWTTVKLNSDGVRTQWTKPCAMFPVNSNRSTVLETPLYPFVYLSKCSVSGNGETVEEYPSVAETPTNSYLLEVMKVLPDGHPTPALATQEAVATATGLPTSCIDFHNVSGSSTFFRLVHVHPSSSPSVASAPSSAAALDVAAVSLHQHLVATNSEFVVGVHYGQRPPGAVWERIGEVTMFNHTHNSSNSGVGSRHYLLIQTLLIVVAVLLS